MIATRTDFPTLTQNPGLIYLDSAATALKPASVIETITRAYADSYATVHRGVYQRSQAMTEAFEAARARVAGFIGGTASELVFVRGATEAINLVANSWGNSHLQAGDRLVLTELEHHSNIVPWQLLRDRLGLELAVIPLAENGDLDYEAAAALLTPPTRLLAVTHVSNVLGTRVDVRRLADMAHAAGAKILVDGCQAVAHGPVDVAALGADFYCFSAHKLYGPTGIGALWARAEILDSMPPWQGGGAMIEQVSFARSTFAPPPQRFEAGTPHIVGALGFAAAIDYVESLGIAALHAHEAALTRAARAALATISGVEVLGSDAENAIVSFVMRQAHPHDIATLLDEAGINIRAGHHCAQPLMARLGVPATARLSFGVYNSIADLDPLVRALESVVRIFR